MKWHFTQRIKQRAWKRVRSFDTLHIGAYQDSLPNSEHEERSGYLRQTAYVRDQPLTLPPLSAKQWACIKQRLYETAGVCDGPASGLSIDSDQSKSLVYTTEVLLYRYWCLLRLSADQWAWRKQRLYKTDGARDGPASYHCPRVLLVHW